MYINRKTKDKIFYLYTNICRTMNIKSFSFRENFRNAKKLPTRNTLPEITWY